MKKLLALTLAVAMVMSMAAVAFAATELVYSIDSVGKEYYKVVSKEVYLSSAANPMVSYGNTIYYPLFGNTYDKKSTPNAYAVQATYQPVTKYDAVKSVKITQDWDMGSEWVSKVDIVKKKMGASGDYQYYLAITFKAAPTKSESVDVSGELTLKKTSGDNKINRGGIYSDAKEGELEPFLISLELQYAKGTSTLEITDGSKNFHFDTEKALDEDEETEFTFTKWEGAYFLVNTYGQGKIVLKATTDYNADVGALYPEANLDFYNGNGANFNKTGEMFLPADEGTFLYELKNGALVEIPSAEYDEYEEGFFFRTRTLGVYVISDVELDVSAAPVVTPGEGAVDGGITVVEPGDSGVVAPTVPVNPGTGAAA